MNAALWRHVAVGGGYLLLWLLLDAVSFLFEVSPGVSPWYLPHGLSLALIAVFGPGYLPLLAAGPLINGSLIWLPGETQALVPLSLALLLTYGAGGVHLHRRGLDPHLGSLRDVGLFLGTGFATSVAAALAGVGALVLGGVLPASHYLPSVGTFWSGDTLGVFGLGALFLAVAAHLRERLEPGWAARPRPVSDATVERGARVVVQALVLAVFTLLASHRWGLFPHPPLFLLSLPVLWLAFLHGSRGAVLTVAAANTGPLLVLVLEGAMGPSLAELQLQLAVVSVAGLALGGAVSEARRRGDELVRVRAETEASRKVQRTHAALRERMKELRCLYRVLELTTDDSRPMEGIASEVARILPPSLLHDGDAVARVRLGGRDFESPDWSEPVATLRRAVASGEESFGFIEVGYRSPQPLQPGGEGPFIAEEVDLVEGVATHIARMIKSRRTSEHLARAERSSAIGQLTGGVAHDFNNLLTVILGNADLLAESLDRDPEREALAAMIRSAAERGAELTGRLLAFARRQPLQPTAVDVGWLISGMRSLLRSSLGEDIEIETFAAPDLGRAHADPAQLESALLNICLNARDAMPDGGRLTIATANTDLDETILDPEDEASAGAYVMIAVSDTGTGIPPDDVSRVFEPFFTTKEVGKGSGLGLSMVQGFVKQSGGHVAIRSTAGQGTTVELFLPRTEDGERHKEGKEKARAGLPCGSERILLVEDDPLVRDYAAAQLTALGYRVVVAKDGLEALDVLEGEREIDLLFTDVVMPGGLDGRQLAEKALRRRPELKVLYTSGYAEDAIVHRGRLDRGVALLGKPYRSTDLARKLREVLDEGQKRRPS